MWRIAARLSAVVVLGVCGARMAVPASASTVIDSCAIVAHPNANHHTPCPAARLASAALSGLNLNYADLHGDDLVGADLSAVTLRHSDFSSSARHLPGRAQPALGHVHDGADLTRANLTHTNLTEASTTATISPRSRWASTTCPDGTNSDANANTCIHNLT